MPRQRAPFIVTDFENPKRCEFVFADSARKAAEMALKFFGLDGWAELWYPK